MERSARRRPPDRAPRAPVNHQPESHESARENTEPPTQEVNARVNAGKTTNPDRIRDRVDRYHAAQHGIGAAMRPRGDDRAGASPRCGSCADRSTAAPPGGRLLPPTEPRTPDAGVVIRTPTACSGASTGGVASSASPAHRPSVVVAPPRRSTGRCGVTTAGRFRLAWRPIRRRGRRSGGTEVRGARSSATA